MGEIFEGGRTRRKERRQEITEMEDISKNDMKDIEEYLREE